VNLKSKSGHTALDSAKSEKHTEIKELLKKPRVQINKQNQFSKIKNQFSKLTNQPSTTQTQPSKAQSQSSKTQNQSSEVQNQPSNLKGREEIERLDFSSSE
jgi:hypothetical protein